MPIKYRDIIIHAFRFTWHYKFLWFFGLFTALIAGSVLQFFSGNDQFLLDWKVVQETGLLQASALPHIADAAGADPVGFAVFAAAFLLVIALAVFLVWLGTVSQGALLWSGARLHDKKRILFREAVQAGRSYLWPILSLHILQRLALWAVVTGMGAVVAVSIVKEMIVIDLAATFALLLLMAVTFVVVMTIRYALLYVTTQEQSFGEALYNAVVLWRRKPILTIEAGLIMFSIQVLLGFLFTVAFSALLIPWLFFFDVLRQWNAMGGIMLFLGTGVVIFVAVIAFGGALITAFREILWAVFFADLHKNDRRSALAVMLGFQRAAGVKKKKK